MSMYRTPSFGSVSVRERSTLSSRRDSDSRVSDRDVISASGIPRVRGGQSMGQLERGSSTSRVRDMTSSTPYIPLAQRTGYMRPTSRELLRSSSASSTDDPVAATNNTDVTNPVSVNTGALT